MKSKKEVAFLKKSSAKNFCPGDMGGGEGAVRKSWMPAFAGMAGFVSGTGPDLQKFFAELFFKKATACFP